MAKRKVRRKKATKRVKRMRRVAKPGGTTASMQGAMAGLSAYQRRLLADRAAIDTKISAIEHALSALGARPAPAMAARGRRPAGKGRGFRAGSLKEYIARVLAGRGVMSVKDVTEGVLSAGYRTRNKTLSKSVGIAMTQMKGVRKVGRGRFRFV